MSRQLAAAPSPSRLRDWAFALTVGLVLTVVVLALSVVVVVRALRDDYPDLHAGNWFGPAEGFPDHLSDDDDARWRLAGAEQVFAHPLVNDGDEDVRVLAVHSRDRFVTNIRWRAFRDPGNGGSISGLLTAWRSFPAVIPAEGQIIVRFTVRRVGCPTLEPGSSVGTSAGLVVDWLGDGELRSTPVYSLAADDGIDVCVG